MHLEGPGADGKATEVAAALDRLLEHHPPAMTPEFDFWAAQFDLGLAWVHFPIGSGGLGVGRDLQAMVDERIIATGGSTANRARNVVGIGYAAEVLVAYDRSADRDEVLRRTFTTEDMWCQLFSEPGAGSDLAGLATSAMPDGDEWVVTGQKVWTTLAHVARWGLLIARTDPDVPKHRGLTFFVLDMKSPGIEVRPLFEITGEAEFNEVFLDGVRVHDGRRLGEVGDGWKVALRTLQSERVSASSGRGDRDRSTRRLLLGGWSGAPAPVRDARRDDFVRHWIDAELLDLNTARSAAAGAGDAGPDGSVLKLQWAEHNQAATSFVLDLMSGEGQLLPGGYTFERPEGSEVGTLVPVKAFLRARANTIEGGTSEIMRNLIAERTLGLPSEPRHDRDVPWRDVPRN